MLSYRIETSFASPRGRMEAGAGLAKSLKAHEARPKIARCIRHRMGKRC